MAKAMKASLMLALLLPTLLLQMCVAFPQDSPNFDVTSYFGVTINSTCGDPPTLYESQSNPGVFANCSSGEHDAQFVLDGDINTWWQSENGATPVLFTFSLQQPSLSLELVGVRLRPRALPPLFLLIEVLPRGGSDYTLTHVYTDEEGGCTEYDSLGVPCSGYIVDGDDTVLCSLNSSVAASIQAVSQLRLTAIGYQPTLSDNAQYFALEEATIFGWVAEGYYVPSLHAISVEGETALIVDTLTPVDTATDEELFPGFTGRGYAVLQFNNTVQPSIQWMFPSLPKASRYQLVLRYRNLGSSRPLMAMVVQGSQVYMPRFTLLSQCGESPVCYATGMLAVQINGTFVLNPAELSLTEEAFTITVDLSSTDLLLDSITAIPEEFYNPSSLEDPATFVQNCGSVIEGSAPADDPFCLQTAVQLSTEFYDATYACNCDSTGSLDLVCDEYGGQCPCLPAAVGFTSIQGKQCNLCPFFSYLTPDGCAACGCPDPSDDCGLPGANGQCSCPQFVIGRSCDRCQENTFGDPSNGCTLCTCNSTGTELCNNQTGECVCKNGVTGSVCDQCVDGFYNFTSLGCAACECNSMGGNGVSCDESGQCQCKSGVGGLKCSECLEGHYFFSDDGCPQCDCSGRTTTCQQASNVTSDPQEVCQCPFPYTGDSCEGCIPGYFLSDISGDCEPCRCNNRSTTCLPGGGICDDCGSNSTGDSCDVCIDGFHDADPGDGIACQPCPCSTITAFNTSCYSDLSGSPVCYCRPGHEGTLCDSCSEGHFGQPPTTRCTQCTCNGNIDPSTPGSCNTTTGRCLLCINNTVGDECETCASGFYGDATQHNCQSCDCNPEGADSFLCDNVTGQCSCLPGTNGLQCTQCLPGFWNFQSGAGCEECVCGEGSVSGECDRVTGACSCVVGVSGLDCSVCSDGFYNFTQQGCTPCDCGLGSMNTSCDPIGQCYCQPGVMGTKCDSCMPFHKNLTSEGCEPCGECEQNLRNMLQEAEGSLGEVRLDTDQLESLIETDVRGLGEVGVAYQEVNSTIAVTRASLAEVDDELQGLNASTAVTVAATDATQSQNDAAWVRSAELLPEAVRVNQFQQSVYDETTDTLFEVADAISYIYTTNATIAYQAEQATAIEGNITSVASEHMDDFSSQVTMAEMTLVDSQTVYNDVQLALMLAESQEGQAAQLQSQYEHIRVNTTILSASVSELERQLEQVGDDLDYASNCADQLEANVSVIESTIAFSLSTLDEAEVLLMQIQGYIILARDDIDVLTTLIGEEVVGSGSSSASGLAPDGMGSGLVPDGMGSGLAPDGMGSGLAPDGMGSGLVLTPDDQQTILEGVAALESVVSSLEVIVRQCAVVVSSAQQHAGDLEQQAADIERILNASLEAGGAAVEAIMVYSEAIAMVERALNLTMETNDTIVMLLEEAEQLMAEQLQQQASLLLNTSQMVLSEVQQLDSTVKALLVDVAEAEAQTATAVNQSLYAEQLATSLAAQVQELGIATEVSLGLVSSTLDGINTELDTVTRIHDAIAAIHPVLLSNVSTSQRHLELAQESFTAADMALDAANASVQDALEAHTTRVNITDSILMQMESNEEQLDSIDSSISTLRAKLQAAREAAASIDLALRFYGNSSLGYRLPTETATDPNATSISLAFRPSDTTTGLMFYQEGAEGGNLQLHLSNGSVLFEFGSTLLATPAGMVQPDLWYQLYATREGSVGRLSVSPLQGGSTFTTLQQSTSPSPLTTDTIYLGGLPDTIGASSLETTDFLGCLDRVVVNSGQLSLLTRDDRQQLDSCGPRPPSESPRLFENGTWFHGIGSYVQLSASQHGVNLTAQPLRVELAFRTYSEDGLLFQMYDGGLVQYAALFLSGGRVVMEFSLTGLEVARLETSAVYNDGQWYYVTAELHRQNGSLVVNSTEVLRGSISNLLGDFAPYDIFWVGGLTSDVQMIMGSSVSFAGCLGGLTLNGVMVELGRNINDSRVSYNGCPAEVSPGVRFMGEEGLVVFPYSGEFSNISLAFRSIQLEALVLAIPTQTADVSYLTAGLYHSRVRVGLDSPSSLNSTLTLESTQGGLSDNRWHQVTVAMETNSLTLTVDGESVSTLLPSPILTDSYLIVGGPPSQPFSNIVGGYYRGCMDALAVNGELLDFNSVDVDDPLQLESVSLYGCRPPAITVPLPPPPPPLPPPPSIRPNITVGLDGTPGSFLAVTVTEDEIAENYIITLEFQTVSADAILLYTQGSASIFADYMALELREGRLYYSYNLGSGRVYIISSGTYNDGYVHMVELRRSGRLGEMITDGGTEDLSDVSPANFTSLNANSGLLFVGGIPPGMSINLLPPGEVPAAALICLHALSINGIFENLSAPQAAQGVADCLQTYTNMVALEGDGYIQIVDNVYVGVQFTFSVEFRTTVCSGLLAYVASPLYSDHIVLELYNGTVRFVFDNGPGKVLVEYVPTNSSELCDNGWHVVVADKDGATGTLTIDHTTTITQTSPFQQFYAVNTDDPLYVGGVPDTVRLRYTVMSGAFDGCLANPQLTAGDDGEMQTLLLAQSSESGGVTFHTCQG